MIALRIKTGAFPGDDPFVVRLIDDQREVASPYDALLVFKQREYRDYDIDGMSLRLHVSSEIDLNNDVIIVSPRQKHATRIIRATARFNSLLITEQCDQLCVMCSQPPKKHHVDLFDQFLVAVSLAPKDSFITLSGGEPMLHKSRLFWLLEHATNNRPDLRFHILTNGQHFTTEDAETLLRIGVDKIMWGIPLYSHLAEEHDQIVVKDGAFDRLVKSFEVLLRISASIELRTVVLNQNWNSLPKLADYIAMYLPFVTVWALMQVENIGFARMNWGHSFLDTSVDFSKLGSALNIAQTRGIETALYNFPLCTIPSDFRSIARPSISDWKQKFLDVCAGCSAQSSCGGFFEWYNHTKGFKEVSVL